MDEGADVAGLARRVTVGSHASQRSAPLSLVSIPILDPNDWQVFLPGALHYKCNRRDYTKDPDSH